jgi:hypothetical protein
MVEQKGSGDDRRMKGDGRDETSVRGRMKGEVV